MTRDRANTFLYYLMGGVGGLIALVAVNAFATWAIAYGTALGNAEASEPPSRLGPAGAIAIAGKVL